MVRFDGLDMFQQAFIAHVKKAYGQRVLDIVLEQAMNDPSLSTDELNKRSVMRS